MKGMYILSVPVNIKTILNSICYHLYSIFTVLYKYVEYFTDM